MIRPRRAALIRLAEGEVDLRHPRRVAITQDVGGEDKTSYQSFLALSGWPDELRFPGCEWAYDVQRLPFPVGMSLRWTVLAIEQALAAVRAKKQEVGDQIRHAAESGEELPLAVQAAREQLLLLEELKLHRHPTLRLNALFCVYSQDAKTCGEHRAELRGFFKDRHLEVECPTGDQWTCFNEFLPGGEARLGDYTHRLLPEVVAAGMPGATFALGDPDGACIGLTPWSKPVYLDPARGPQVDKSASIAFLGTLGGGKSYTANLLTYLGVFLNGARALILDPKSERGHWPDALPELGGRINVVSLSARPEDDGKLDPFALARQHPSLRKWAGNMAVTMLAFLINAKQGDSRMLAVMEAVDEALRRNELFMRSVVDRLLQAEEGTPAAEVGR